MASLSYKAQVQDCGKQLKTVVKEQFSISSRLMTRLRSEERILVNGAPMPDVLEATATKDKTTVGFGPITFTKPGTYQYGIKERDTGNQNINYDLSTHLVEVTIDKSADGKSLVVRSVKYDGGDSLTIRNTYKNAISRVITGVRTGDDSQMIIWFVLMIAAASAVIISIYIRKKRNS